MSKPTKDKASVALDKRNKEKEKRKASKEKALQLQSSGAFAITDEHKQAALGVVRGLAEV